MTRFRMMFVLVAVLAAASPASAQHRGGGPVSSDRHNASAETKQASGGAWNGTASQWGGSPVQAPAAGLLRFLR